MLVLNRSKNETIVINTRSGEEVIVTVVDVQGKSVKLGFAADPTTTIKRSEHFSPHRQAIIAETIRPRMAG